MKQAIGFYKMVASGNDFIVLDNRTQTVRAPKAFAAKVCPMHTAVGADGVLLIEPSKRADFFLRVINADGSEAEACGNGYRCVGRFAHERLGFSKKMTFETLAGLISLEVGKDLVKVRMTEPHSFRPDMSIDVGGKKLRLSFIDTGVPHAVVYSEGLDRIPVFELGRAVRYHDAFGPKGANVNFVELNGGKNLRIRTYERGVEDETLACGTGAVAAAAVSLLTGRASSPVSVMPKSGEALTVYLEKKGAKIQEAYLEGNASFVYEGKLLL